MGLFDMFKKNSETMQSSDNSVYPLTLQINARLQPFDRGDIYEDPIAEALEECGCGTTVGGGTMMQENGEIAFCDVQIDLNNDSKESIDKLMQILEDIHLPKGSFLRSESSEHPIGTLEGLALYINGTDLPNEVYQSCDINYVVEKANELLIGIGKMYSHWQGPNDSALYFYGASFDEMKKRIEPFLFEYPLCQKCRIEKIA